MMFAFLRRLGHDVNIKRVDRLYHLMDLEALVPKPPTSTPANSDDTGHRIYPRGLELYGTPEIFNTDQGSQYTSDSFTSILIECGSAISMDGRGRAIDNVFVERLWRSYKYEYLYLCCPDIGADLYSGTDKYMRHFNWERPHSSLGGASPAAIYLSDANRKLNSQRTASLRFAAARTITEA
jgi:hypothetical protein